MSRFSLIALAFLCSVAALNAVEISKSLVRIEATSQEPNYKTPWSPGDVSSGVGAGFVVDGKRIMTNAHVVSNARFLTVSKEGDPNPYLAKVLHIAHDCDLALLSVENPSFFKGTAPLEFGGIPEIESVVSAYGYPVGGTRLSVTRGIVSRIDFQPYSHSGMDSHLAIQIDAAINPGNSGGPVMQNGKVVGVAFQGYSGDVAQNVGYMIPTPVIQRFLKDVQDGHYDHYVDLALTYRNLFNPASRRGLGLEDETTGVQVCSVYSGGAADGSLKPGDVILKIDGHTVSSDGTIPLENEAVPLDEVVERKFKGDKVELEILRKGKPITVTVQLKEPWPFKLQSNLYDEKPRFVVAGGLVFQPVDQNFMDVHDPSDQRLNYIFDYFIADQLHTDRPEIVVLSTILPDPVNAYAEEFRFSVVDEVNGHRIKRIDDIAKAFDEQTDCYVIKFAGGGRPLVLERKAIEEARPRIRERYDVTAEKNLKK
ncbi:MAG: trypsin-like peptidase domain-containing protein [Verrucomicrobia bacterium]|nr:trypsin-like peptidase domain-containing protein [Verrucomicrobiota bacterium]